MVNIPNFIKNNCLTIKVIPNSDRNELKEENNQLKLYLKAKPEKGKANKELIKFFKKEFGLRVEIKSGEKGREKVLEVLG